MNENKKNIMIRIDAQLIEDIKPFLDEWGMSISSITEKMLINFKNFIKVDNLEEQNKLKDKFKEDVDKMQGTLNKLKKL